MSCFDRILRIERFVDSCANVMCESIRSPEGNGCFVKY